MAISSVPQVVPLSGGGWAARNKARFLPAFPELFLGILLLAVFGRAGSWQALLMDGDTGWHIRAGEFILQSGRVPTQDLFSFSRQGQPWFAWEWLADVVFARFYGWGGLQAVAGLGTVVLCASAAILLAWLLSRATGLWVALAVTLAVVSASTVHYLARPHIFSILLFPLALWILDEDYRKPGPLVWTLAPLSALWANLHGGFLGWLASLALLPLSLAAKGDWRRCWRYAGLTVACAGCTLINPYGWGLHKHIVQYLGSSWIMDNVNEFQSPRIRSENMLVFACLLLCGVALASRPLARRDWFRGGLVLIWAFAALRSARHIPLYAVVAAPVIASELSSWWREVAARSSPGAIARILWDVGEELGSSRRLGVWSLVLVAMVVWLIAPPARIADFPEASFPVDAVARNWNRLAPSDRMPRVLTSDQWGDYLIFRLYPRERVFFDGRSDFYGASVGADYKALLSAGHRWPEVLACYGFDMALLPLDWPLVSVLEFDPAWQRVYRDKVAVLFVRRSAGIKKSVSPAECKSDG
jgi:hypothetical protein